MQNVLFILNVSMNILNSIFGGFSSMLITVLLKDGQFGSYLFF